MVGKLATAALTALTFMLATAQAGQSRLDWPDLADPAAQTFDDPFLALDNEALLRLSTIARLRERLSDADVADVARPRLQARIDEAGAALAAAGIDAELLLSQRETVRKQRMRAGVSGNPALDGRTVGLSGFMVPAPDAPDGSAIAYLVPELGMCSHYPPPMPNQLIRLRLSDEVLEAGLHFAATVTGNIRLEETDQQIFIIDGPVRMWSSWIMEVDQVIPWDGSDPPG